MMRRLFAVMTVVALVAGCMPRVEPAGPAVVAPAIRDGGMIAADGAKLPYRRWLPAGRPKAVVLALHGFNDYSNAFKLPAAYLAGRGIATYAYDQRGFGAAPNRGVWAGTATMIGDLRTMAGLLRRAHPNVPLYLMGESMGGAVVLVATAGKNSVQADGAILIAPAVWGRRHMGAIPRAMLWLFSRTVPWLTVTGQGLEIQASDNFPMLRALGRDPMVIKETRVDAIHGLVDLMDEAFGAAPALSGPALILYGRRDEVIPERPVREMLNGVRHGEAVRTALYKGGFHMLLRDLKAETVLADIAAWIADPRAPLPSGADAAAAKRTAENNTKGP